MALYIDDYCDQENCEKCLSGLKLEFSIEVDKVIKEVRQHRWAMEQELADLQRDLAYVEKVTSVQKENPRFDETFFFIRQRIRLEKEIPLCEKCLATCTKDGQTLLQMRGTGGEQKTDRIKYNLWVIEGFRASHAS
ncbi:MAG: hypothetical protein MMC33_006432 [Icmadophila ericetorum]|nr:hypothetical protein [Icmadophila ericetorum]